MLGKIFGKRLFQALRWLIALPHQPRKSPRQPLFKNGVSIEHKKPPPRKVAGGGL